MTKPVGYFWQSKSNIWRYLGHCILHAQGQRMTDTFDLHTERRYSLYTGPHRVVAPNHMLYPARSRWGTYRGCCSRSGGTRTSVKTGSLGRLQTLAIIPTSSVLEFIVHEQWIVLLQVKRIEFCCSDCGSVHWHIHWSSGFIQSCWSPFQYFWSLQLDHRTATLVAR